MPQVRYDPRLLDRDLPTIDTSFIDEEIRSLVFEATKYYSISADQPIVLTSEWVLDEDLTEFARRLRLAERGTFTPRTYAIEAESFIRFLRIRFDKSISDIGDEEIFAYRRERLEGSLSVRLSNNSWNKISAVILRLLKFYQIHIPGINWKSLRVSRDGDDNVRMIDLEHYKTFRDGGMMAKRNPLRNGAFSEILVTTGLRCNESAHILLHEAPRSTSFKSHNSRLWSIPATITKWEKQRDVIVSKRVARDYLEPYIIEERSHFVERRITAQYPHRNYDLNGLSKFNHDIFFEIVRPGVARVIAGEADKNNNIPFSNFSEFERERLVEVKKSNRSNYYTIHDFGPLWLSERGTYKEVSAWRSTFANASKLIGEVLAHSVDVTAHVLRHTFAVYLLSFLLQGLVELRINRGTLDRRGEVYDVLVGDPLAVLQELLGHASIVTTHKYLRFNRKNSELVRNAFAKWDEGMGLSV